MSLKLGTLNIAGLSERTKYNAHSLLDFKWTDHILNEVSWLRADTFSWQSGLVYVAAYNALVSDLSGATSTTETIAGTEITYYRTSAGRKICLAAQEANVLTIYNTTGYGWYYILDTTNTRFKLPRNKWGFTGLRDDAGNYVEQYVKLPNITGAFFSDGVTSNNVSGAFGYVDAGKWGAGSNDSSYWREGYITIDASRSSSVYSGNGTDTAIQPPSVQMYLYFYVGDFEQTEIAGISANLIANTDLTNVNNTGKIAIAHNAMPSNTYDDLTVGAINTQYTAPADGYYTWNEAGAGNSTISFILLENITTSTISTASLVNSQASMGVTLPVRKNDVVKINYYNLLSWSGHYLRFVYAVGSESEAS